MSYEKTSSFQNFLGFQENTAWVCPIYKPMDKLSNPAKSLSKSTQSNLWVPSMPWKCLAAHVSRLPYEQAFRWIWTQPIKQLLLHKVPLQGNPKSAYPQVILNWLNASDSLNSIALLLLTFWHHLNNWHSISLSLHSTNTLDWFLQWIKTRRVTSEFMPGNTHICVYIKKKHLQIALFNNQPTVFPSLLQIFD